jgi:hypothetical protein
VVAVCVCLAGVAPLIAAHPVFAQQTPGEPAPADPWATPPEATPPPEAAPADPWATPPEATPPPARTPPPDAPGYPPPRLTEPMVAPQGPRVFLSSDNPNPRLQQLSRVRWEDVCLTPCGVRVDPHGLYRIGGGTVRKTDPFRLPARSGDVIINVEAGSNVKHFVGLGLMIGGAVSIGYGALFYLVSRNEQTYSDPYLTNYQNNTNDTVIAVAVVLAVVGAVLEGVGISLWNSETTIHIH